MRVVVVPEGRVKTKPRALNLALGPLPRLDHRHLRRRGRARTRPDPQGGRPVPRRGPEVACLQGVLDYYNPRTNWLSRCFTIEYATWFRLILPGIARLGLAVPLGGTTLFFRRDGDRGTGRLGCPQRHRGRRPGHAPLPPRLPDRTDRHRDDEEANCRMIPWVKQRSRWIKGYMMTWASTCATRSCCGAAGAGAFLGFQVMFLGSILQFLLAPLLWSFWIIPLGLPHPVAGACRRLPCRPWPGSFSPRPQPRRDHCSGRAAPFRAPPLAALGADAAWLFPAGQLRRLQGAVGTDHPSVLLGQDDARHLRSRRAGLTMALSAAAALRPRCADGSRTRG
jgi:hypothetical protein